MTALAFHFKGTPAARLHFSWPVDVAPTVSHPARLRNLRYRALMPRFPGQIPIDRVRAGTLGSGWQSANPSPAESRSGWRSTPVAAIHTTSRWQDARKISTETAALWGDVAIGARDTQAAWGAAAPLEITAQSAFKRTPVGAALLASGWRYTPALTQSVQGIFMRSFLRRAESAAPWRSAHPFGQLLSKPFNTAVLQVRAWRVPWQDAQTVGGLSWPWPALPPLPPGPQPQSGLRFHFDPPHRWPPLSFHFGRWPAAVIPTLRSYHMLHTVEIVKLPNREPLAIKDATLSCAWDEWGWGLSASFVGDATADLLRPVVSEALEVEIIINGYVWQFRLDRVSGAVAFNSHTGPTQGRSRAALLGPGVALAVNGYEDQTKTAQQLAAQELVNTGWQLDWRMVDWTVPARRFSYQQKTPLDVIVQLAAVAGGRVMADPANSWLRVTPRYHIPPWQWDATTPDVILPRAICATLNWEPRHGKPWDALYLGDGVDVLSHVKRAGLPGVSTPESLLIDPLLSDAQACRARGIQELADAVAGVDFSLALPLSDAAGIAPLRQIGELVRFGDGGKLWAGIITAVSIRAHFGEVLQTLAVRAVEVTT